MKRLFILIAVCMIGMVNALAGFTVVPPEESETGSYVLTFKETAVEGETLYEWSDIAENGSLDFLLDATSLKIVTDGSTTFSDSDMEKLMGGDNANTLFPNLQSLDMGDAVLADNGSLARMRYAKGQNAKGLTNLTSFTFPKTTTSIPAGAFSENTKLQEIIMLEGSLTTIADQAFQGCTSLSNVRIPDGVTAIGENVFEHCAFDAISLPNTLNTIGTNAFGYCENLKTITIPASVTSIGPSAFQHNSSLTDVYIIGEEVKIGDQAFDHNLTQNEFKYNGSLDGDPNTVTIKDWTSQTGDNVGQVPLRLHIPNSINALLHYMNPYLRFLNSLKDPALVKRALQDLNDSHASDDQYVQQTINYLYHWLEDKWYDNAQGHEDEAELAKKVFEKLQTICNVTVNDKGVYRSENWEEMDGWRYFHKGDGKFNFGADAIYNIPPQDRDYFGWWNFMFVAGDIENKTWPDNRMIDSRWYSAVFPFDMSYNQVMTAYGANTDVREFTYVNEHTVNGAKKRTVTFATIPVIPNNDKNEAGFVKKGMPYMIHPGVKSVPVNVGEGEEQTTVYRTIAGVDVDAANAELNNKTKTVLRDLVDGDNNGATLKSEAYTFKGTYKLANIPENTFYLGYDPDPDHYYPLAFYVTRKELVNKWNPFTSIVQHADESGNANSAKTMDLGFKDDGFEIMHGSSIATAIEAAPVVSNMNDGKVYNLSGQVVRENRSQSLAKGVYILNGKKVVIR